MRNENPSEFCKHCERQIEEKLYYNPSNETRHWKHVVNGKDTCYNVDGNEMI